jgi:ABC-type uncharacterized transport system ATPase subunit
VTGLLETESVCKSFGTFRAVREVSLTVAPRAIHGLVGPNGSGKSTLLNLICGRLRPDSGTVSLRGEPITRLHAHHRSRRGIGVKLQLTEILPELTAQENLRVAVRNASRQEVAARVEEGLELTELTAQRDVPARRLSHGERKWLEIAAVLVNRPSVLLLDEPTSAMSPPETSRCAELLRRWLDEKRVESILLVEHDTRFVESLCDRVTVLHQGQVLAEGTFGELRQIQAVQDAYLGRR